MTDVKKVQKNRIAKHLLGPVTNSNVLWMLVIFFVSVELVVVPSFSIFDEFFKNYLQLEHHILFRSILELSIVLCLIWFSLQFLKKEFEKSGDTLPLSVKENTFSQHSVIADTSPISLIIGLSDANCRGDEDKKSIWKFNLSGLPKLGSPSFPTSWNKSTYEFHNWRQPLFCISYFLQKGRYVNVYMFTSTENRHEFEFFKEVVLKLYSGNRLAIKPISDLLDGSTKDTVNKHGLNYNNVEEISTCLDKAVRSLEASEENSEIILDVTCGTKLVAVASAIVSFSQGRSFVYTENSGATKTSYAAYGDVSE